MKIVCVDPRTHSLWQELVRQRRSDVFHSPEWMRVLGDTYGFDIQAYVLLDEAGESLAGIPFCRIKDIKEKRLVTLPFSDYCDPLVEDDEQWAGLTEPLLAEDSPYTIRCVHNNIPLADGRLRQVNRAKWHSLDLQPDLDTIWRGLHGSARRAIRKAERKGVMLRTAE